MDYFLFLKIVAIILTFVLLIYFALRFSNEELSRMEQVKIATIGLVANFLDTIGIGSFAVIVAMRKMLGVMSDDVKLIGTMNIQAAVTALAQMLIFLHFVHVDLITILVGIGMITLGGFLSGLISVRISKKLVRNTMLWAFIVTGILLFLIQIHVLNLPANNESVRGVRLAVFAIFMLVAGMLPAFGVGYYSLIETTIFMFGLKPIVAFPIMTSASSYQMPLTAATFINKGKFYGKSAVIMAVFGVVGVLGAATLINTIDGNLLKWILLLIVIYNIIVLSRNK
jgi:uncharacterized membrane protein YfcA